MHTRVVVGVKPFAGIDAAKGSLACEENKFIKVHGVTAIRFFGL